MNRITFVYISYENDQTCKLFSLLAIVNSCMVVHKGKYIPTYEFIASSIETICMPSKKKNKFGMK